MATRQSRAPWARSDETRCAPPCSAPPLTMAGKPHFESVKVHCLTTRFKLRTLADSLVPILVLLKHQSVLRRGTYHGLGRRIGILPRSFGWPGRNVWYVISHNWRLIEEIEPDLPRLPRLLVRFLHCLPGIPRYLSSARLIWCLLPGFSDLFGSGVFGFVQSDLRSNINVS